MNNKPLTKKDLTELAKETLLPTVDKLIKSNLAEFTEETLLPGVERIIDDQIDEKVPKIVNKVKLDLIDHFDEKIADLRGDIILLLRKDDRRFLHLVDVLYKKNVLNKNDIKTIEELQLFPRVL